RIDLRLAQPRDIFLFIVTILIGPIPIAVLGVAILAAVGLTPPDHFGEALFNWWIGDAIGLLVITPLALVIAIPGLQLAFKSGVRSVWLWFLARRLNHVVELLAQIASAMVVLWMTFIWPKTNDLHIFYLSFLPLIWTCLRFG